MNAPRGRHCGNGARPDTGSKAIARPLFFGSILYFLLSLPGAGGCIGTENTMDQRTPAEIREQGNRLQDEGSLYLQQHSHNPVDWYPWSAEALARARAEDKPIFLSIGYASCHWCHVMEHEVFEDDDVAAFLNAHYICIKVDREERPDLDATYMEAVQLLTRGGGWPMSVFLTPDLKPFWGGTYFPRAAFMELVTRIQSVYTESREDLEAQAAQVSSRISSRPDFASVGAVTDEMIAAAAASSAGGYDEEYGGFGTGQKFPTPPRWRFLLHRFRRTGDPYLSRILLQTLEAMARGGLCDQVGGGFHRYTVDRNWTVPHFEKMLYDNAQLAGLFFEAGVVFEREDFTDVGRDVLEFLMREMRDQRGAYYASFDADSGGHEGTYYIWSRGELLDLAGPADGARLADFLGVQEQGNFEHGESSVLTRRADMAALSEESGLDDTALDALFKKWRPELLRFRADRTPPGLDPKIITAWNGLALSALSQGYAATGEVHYLDAAREAAEFLLRQHRNSDGSLARASSEGRRVGHGILDDYAFLSDGLLDLYQAGGGVAWLRAARELTDFVRDDFRDDETVFTHASSAADSPLGRRVELFDSVLPSGNSVMIQVMIRLTALTGRPEYRDEARAHIEAQSGLLGRAGLEMAGYFDAAEKTARTFRDVVIAGDPDDPHTRALLETARSALAPGAVHSTVPAEGPSAGLLKEAPALGGKIALGGEATAYVCEYGTCQAPTTDPAEMRRQMLRDWIH